MAAFVLSQTPGDVYSAEEIARAAGVPVGPVVAALGGGSGLVSFADAARVSRALAHGRRPPQATAPRQLFSSLTLGLTPDAATLRIDDRPEPMRLVFLVTPGPGGGGGGGGLLQPAPPPKAMREGHQQMSSPIPPKRIVPIPAPPEPKPAPKAEVLPAEPLPAVVAPIVAAPADPRTRIGVVAQAAAQAESHGSGGGVGTGTGTGLGEGAGAGIGPGSGGGIGGGPYRPGGGIEAPQLLREVKADYTEEARQRGIEGDVVLEIIVRRDGTVGSVKVLQGLGSGLNDRAVQAVRHWRFAPAQHLGTPVDVTVEVAVEFTLR